MKLADLKIKEENNDPQVTNTYIARFYELYPKVVGNYSEFYLNRCDAINPIKLRILFNINYYILK